MSGTRTVELTRRDCEQVLEANSGALAVLRALRGETLVVTGGTGFMGSWIAEMVSALNDLHGLELKLLLVARGTEEFRLRRPHLANRRDVGLLRADVRHLIDLPRETGWLIHAAATPDTRFHATRPVETMQVIAEGTAGVLRAVDRASNLKMFLNVSSGLVYGTQPLELERIPESFGGAPQAGSVSSAYAEAKRYAETLTSAARSQARIPAATVRPFAFVGPYQSLDSPWAVTNFIRDALERNPIKVQGDGKTVRSYLYGADMAFWLLRILVGARSGGVYNLGSDEAVTLEHLAQMIAAKFSPTPDIQLRSAPGSQTQLSRFVPSVSAVTEQFGLRATIDLAAAVERTIVWHQR